MVHFDWLVHALPGLRFTCRAEDHKWVTDRNFFEDEMGMMVFWDKPYRVYEAASANAYDTMFDLLCHIREIMDISAALGK